MDDEYNIIEFGIHDNADMRTVVRNHAYMGESPRLVIEQIASMGMAVGAETFETVYWSGKFSEAFFAVSGREADRIPRVPIKVHLCGTAKAKDANVRQALIDRFGGSSALQKAKAAKGKKGVIVEPAREAGPLAGIFSHCWSALAVAVVYIDRLRVDARQALKGTE
mgnify:CR=1 FL=1